MTRLRYSIRTVQALLADAIGVQIPQALDPQDSKGSDHQQPGDPQEHGHNPETLGQHACEEHRRGRGDIEGRRLDAEYPPLCIRIDAQLHDRGQQRLQRVRKTGGKRRQDPLKQGVLILTFVAGTGFEPVTSGL